MILKQLRISRHLSQEQLALMSGLNVRTIQRIESGHKPSLESLKSLASVLEVDVSTLNQEIFVIDKNTANWESLPFWLKCWFFFNFLNLRPTRAAAKRVEVLAHASGFVFCAVRWAAIRSSLTSDLNARTSASSSALPTPPIDAPPAHGLNGAGTMASSLWTL